MLTGDAALTDSFRCVADALVEVGSTPRQGPPRRMALRGGWLLVEPP
ncbi:hypothetical protein OHA77_38295 [Streptosporangium sp. NBC_01639]|nr:hypothetical protein OHA77_38295 [Streptosporangium sp. NBC_01639]